MPTSEAVLRVSYSDEITSNPEWYELAQRATGFLQDEILRGGGIAPIVLADWSLDEAARCGQPTFKLFLSDTPDESKPAWAVFSEELIRGDGKLRDTLYDLWGSFLRHRSRRLARDINLYISGSISGSEGGK